MSPSSPPPPDHHHHHLTTTSMNIDTHSLCLCYIPSHNIHHPPTDNQNIIIQILFPCAMTTSSGNGEHKSICMAIRAAKCTLVRSFVFYLRWGKSPWSARSDLDGHIARCNLCCSSRTKGKTVHGGGFLKGFCTHPVLNCLCGANF